MKTCKYIIFTDKASLRIPNRIPILFPELLQHSEVAKSFPDWEPVSAGFFGPEWNFGPRKAYGESISLFLKSDIEDTSIIQMILGIEG